MGMYVGNGMCESIEEPTPEQMRAFLFDVDATDIEHGAAWLDKDGIVLEWSPSQIVFSRDETNRHLPKVSRERALALWLMLAEGRLDELEAQGWVSGNGWRPEPERDAALAAENLAIGRAFYDSLGAERPDVHCRRVGCARGAIALSVFCRPHHYASGRDT